MSISITMLAAALVLALVATPYVYGYNNEDLSELESSDIIVSNLTEDVQTEFLSIANGTLNEGSIFSCFGFEPDYEKVELLLYANNTNSYTLLDPKNPTGIDNDSPLYIITHGYLSGLNGYKMKELRDKYIQLYGKNILYINWGKLAWGIYTTCACNVPYIGQHIAKFLCRLSERQNFDLTNVHMIGHSLGGQLAGQTGKGTQKTCNKKIGKITALDPAGPMFQFTREASRLTPNDAKFVEAIHSNAGLFGYTGKAGTVDYHINCGSVQPGCVVPKDISKLAETTVFLVMCAHMRSVELWPYVLETKEFKAKSCQKCESGMPVTCSPDTDGANYVTLGHTYTKPTSEHYHLTTGAYSPFYS